MNLKGKKKLSAIDCNHANENPYKCPCRKDCYCKENTCKDHIPTKRGER